MSVLCRTVSKAFDKSSAKTRTYGLHHFSSHFAQIWTITMTAELQLGHVPLPSPRGYATDLQIIFSFIVALAYTRRLVVTAGNHLSLQHKAWLIRRVSWPRDICAPVEWVAIVCHVHLTFYRYTELLHTVINKRSMNLNEACTSSWRKTQPLGNRKCDD